MQKLTNAIDLFRIRNYLVYVPYSEPFSLKQADGIGPRLSGEIEMNKQHRQDAAYATMCSYLGLSARDVAEIGGFSDRFARDLLAGRKSFPRDTKKALFSLWRDFESIVNAMKKDVSNGEGILYIYRTNEQLRSSPVGNVWPTIGHAKGAFVGPYRAAAFEVYRWAASPEKGWSSPISLVFAETPEAD
jgi:hypothetical protein